MSTTKKRVGLSLREKVHVLQELEQLGASQATVVREFGVHRSTVSCSKSTPQQLLKNKEDIEDALLVWLQHNWLKELE